MTRYLFVLFGFLLANSAGAEVCKLNVSQNAQIVTLNAQGGVQVVGAEVALRGSSRSPIFLRVLSKTDRSAIVEAMDQATQYRIFEPWFSRSCTLISDDKYAAEVAGSLNEEVRRAQPEPGNCPPGTTPAVVEKPLPSSVGEDIPLPKNNPPCTIKQILDAAAEEFEIPKRLMYAMAWKESTWRHWANSGSVLLGFNERGNYETADYGLCQINKKAHSADGFVRFKGENVPWERIQQPSFNARYSAQLLKQLSASVKRRNSPRTQSENGLFRAVYAAYNGGPAAWDRPWTEEDPRDVGFKKILEEEPWKAKIGDCQ